MKAAIYLWNGAWKHNINIPANILPMIKDSSDDFGRSHTSITGKSYPITGIVGDQQAAAIGQCCFKKGSVKSTYGTRGITTFLTKIVA